MTEEINRTHSIARSSATFSKENCWNLSTLYSAKCGEAQSRFNISFVIVDFILFIYFFCPKLKTVSLLSAPYSLFVFISDVSFGTFVDEGRKNWTDAARGTVASTFNPAAAGAGWWKIQRDRHRERFPLCSVMNVPPTRSLIYIYSRLGLYIYSLWCVCVYIYTGILLNIGTSNQQRNYESCFSFFFFVPTAEECFSIFFFRNLVRFLSLFCFF